ncbi:MAG: MFS transporter, partial [Sinomonas sp.]|nr:MFS transporter [Sinomonas sp.]
MSLPHATPAVTRAAVVPLYAAGFTTANCAHSIAAGLGAEAGAEHSIGLNLLLLGVLLALYDVA